MYQIVNCETNHCFAQLGYGPDGGYGCHGTCPDVPQEISQFVECTGYVREEGIFKGFTDCTCMINVMGPYEILVL